MRWDPVGLPLHPIFEIAPPRDRGGPFALTTWARVGGASRRPFSFTAPLGFRPHGFLCTCHDPHGPLVRKVGAGEAMELTVTLGT